jgi:hypothetical protein
MKNVQYFARITCECGSQIEVETYPKRDPSNYGSARCDPQIEFEPPKGWLGGYRNVPYICPPCVQKKYG